MLFNFLISISQSQTAVSDESFLNTWSKLRQIKGATHSTPLSTVCAEVSAVSNWPLSWAQVHVVLKKNSSFLLCCLTLQDIKSICVSATRWGLFNKLEAFITLSGPLCLSVYLHSGSFSHSFSLSVSLPFFLKSLISRSETNSFRLMLPLFSALLLKD